MGVAGEEEIIQIKEKHGFKKDASAIVKEGQHKENKTGRKEKSWDEWRKVTKIERQKEKEKW